MLEGDNRAFVRNLVEEELRQRKRMEEEGEPLVTFSVRLPVTDLAMLERVGAYLGHKKTPFASMLLRAAVEDAMYGLLVASEEHGNRDEVSAYLQQPIELEDGSGTVEVTFDPATKGGV